jgi:hypothetical protein
MRCLTDLPYFIKYSVHFFTLKMMLKYYLRTIYGRYLRKCLRWLLWWINLQGLSLVKLFFKIKITFFAKNHCEFQVRTILVCTLYSIKYGSLVSSYVTQSLKFCLHFIDCRRPTVRRARRSLPGDPENISGWKFPEKLAGIGPGRFRLRQCFANFRGGN